MRELAQQLAVEPRQLSRLFLEHRGAFPAAVAQTRRLYFAKKLIDETHLHLSEICFAAGFGSVRRFNCLLIETYRRTPSQLRDSAASIAISSRGLVISSCLCLVAPRLTGKPCWVSLLTAPFLELRL